MVVETGTETEVSGQLDTSKDKEETKMSGFVNLFMRKSDEEGSVQRTCPTLPSVPQNPKKNPPIILGEERDSADAKSTKLDLTEARDTERTDRDENLREETRSGEKSMLEAILDQVSFLTHGASATQEERDDSKVEFDRGPALELGVESDQLEVSFEGSSADLSQSKHQPDGHFYTKKSRFLKNLFKARAGNRNAEDGSTGNSSASRASSHTKRTGNVKNKVSGKENKTISRSVASRASDKEPTKKPTKVPSQQKKATPTAPVMAAPKKKSTKNRGNGAAKTTKTIENESRQQKKTVPAAQAKAITASTNRSAKNRGNGATKTNKTIEKESSQQKKAVIAAQTKAIAALTDKSAKNRGSGATKRDENIENESSQHKTAAPTAQANVMTALDKTTIDAETESSHQKTALSAAPAKPSEVSHNKAAKNENKDRQHQSEESSFDRASTQQTSPEKEKFDSMVRRKRKRWWSRQRKKSHEKERNEGAAKTTPSVHLSQEPSDDKYMVSHDGNGSIYDKYAVSPDGSDASIEEPRSFIFEDENDAASFGGSTVLTKGHSLMETFLCSVSCPSKNSLPSADDDITNSNAKLKKADDKTDIEPEQAKKTSDQQKTGANMKYQGKQDKLIIPPTAVDLDDDSWFGSQFSIASKNMIRPWRDAQTYPISPASTSSESQLSIDHEQITSLLFAPIETSTDVDAHSLSGTQGIDATTRASFLGTELVSDASVNSTLSWADSATTGEFTGDIWSIGDFTDASKYSSSPAVIKAELGAMAKELREGGPQAMMQWMDVN